jgi:hypothetical protein
MALTSKNEHQEQVALIQWFRLQHPKHTKCLWAIPNGGVRNIGTAIKLKREGVVPGVSDLFLMIPNSTKHGLFLEMKAKSGKLTTDQKEFINLAESMGYDAKVAYSYEEGKEIIKKYLQE